MHRQQKDMYDRDERKIEDRIVDLYQPHVRPMKTGKDKGSAESGSRQLGMLKDGFTHVHALCWDAFNVGVLLKQAVEAYPGNYGFYEEAVSVDKLFGTRENRRFLKELGISYVGKALGRPRPWLRKNERS